MKTLNTIQTISKVGKILSRIVFICCLVGGIGCIAGIIGLALIPDGFKLGGVTIHSIIESSAEVTAGTCYAAMAVGLVLCAGEAVLSRFAVNYFKNELAAGTPFTLAGAKEMIRLGILAICIPAGTSIVAAIVYAVMRQIFGNVAELDLGNYVSIGLGIMFIVTGLICRYGAEVTGDNGGSEQ